MSDIAAPHLCSGSERHVHFLLRYAQIVPYLGESMANTNFLIVGGVLFIGGLLTIPIVIGIFCAPLGCLTMLIGLIISNPKPQQQVVVIQQLPGS